MQDNTAAEQRAEQQAESQNIEGTIGNELLQKFMELQQIAEREQERANQMEDAAKRLQAEFDNYRKRNNESVKKAKDEGIEEVIVSLLPLADVMEQALSMITDEQVATGVKIIKRQLSELLASYNVEEINPKGEDFNPEYHNAFSRQKVEGIEPGKITEVLQKGYVRGGKILRHASVLIAE